MKRAPVNGLTLIELIVTIAVVAIIATMGVPAYNETILSNRTIVKTNEFVVSLNLARSEAIKRGIQVSLRKSSTNWESGWTVFTDTDSDGQFETGDGDEALRVNTSSNPQFSLRTDDSNFSTWLGYLPTGVATGNGGNTGTFRLCRSDNDTTKSRSISINNTGRVVKSIGTTACP